MRKETSDASSEQNAQQNHYESNVAPLMFTNQPRLHHELLHASTFVNVKKHETAVGTHDEDVMVVLNRATKVQFRDEEE
ncbi:hypothetical protein DEO72_LG7g2062 [Vigna unguiculata]|uniref:Uncharacterized protein n=1 Tax=Vigna unguiculata TaxID=3917 RepID=A0A4D6MJI0_VIGUN|nr:hypothetical protein DEO72_LG7g2062 [Vigna unguiculata]